MAKESLMVKQIEFIVVSRRIKLLGITISVGLVVIYLAGLFVANSNFKENFEIVNISTLLLLVMIFFLTFAIKKIMLRKVNLSNFSYTYFNAHVIPYAVLDFGALFCLTTNLFVNGNILYASIAIVISLTGMLMNFPDEEYFEILKEKSDLK
ncbi:MAG TPA: hypothetical protein PKD83_00270 [Ignavibacteria bacterium]|nr:hypothetical protein [Ignavibacteria bacterium]